MNLYYHKSPSGNFGDDLNLWLWDALLPGWREWDPDRVLVGVGTLLSSSFIKREGSARRRYLVAGAGVGYGTGALPTITDRDRWDVRSVRGPLSARSLGLPDDLGILDPAVMIASLPGFRDRAPTDRPIFVPHESTVTRHDWTTACAEIGLDFVSPCGEARDVIARIAAAPAVLAESMHAAILADAFRVPWIPVQIGHKFLARKWQDWAASLGIDVAAIPPLFPHEERAFALPQRAVAAWRVARRRSGSGTGDAAVRATARPGVVVRLRTRVEGAHVARALRLQMQRRPCLSGERRLARQVDRYHAVLEGIRRDYG